MNALIVIYGPSSTSVEGQKGTLGLEIYHIFNTKGLIDEDLLHRYYEDVCGTEVTALSHGCVGYFSDGSQVQRFCFQLCQHLNHDGVNLLTVKQYNDILMSCHLAEDLPQALSRGGEYIENVDVHKKGFFDSLFTGLK